MPYSYDKFKLEVRDHIIQEISFSRNCRILDVGPGAGTYSDLTELQMDCVEIYEPYVEMYGLKNKYGKVIIGDVTEMELHGKYDYVILGDVLEHIKINQAVNLIDGFSKSGIKCLVAVPYQTEQGEYEGNVYETHHQPDLTPEIMSSRYPSLKLLYGDSSYGYYINYEPKKYPVLFVMTGRRMDLFRRTMGSLVDRNLDIRNKFKSVWLIDDRSSEPDRSEMNIMMKSFFGDKFNSVFLNSDIPFEWVEKYNMMSKFTDEDDYIFLLEDDWECKGHLNINDHINYLDLNPDINQISMADPLWIQNDEIKSENEGSPIYWKNPWPGSFRHPYKYENGNCVWSEGNIKNYTNNPSLIRAKTFHENKFEKIKNFEGEFADRSNLKGHVFTKISVFEHIGSYSSLINSL
jgi:hypothetical protein